MAGGYGEKNRKWKIFEDGTSKGDYVLLLETGAAVVADPVEVVEQIEVSRFGLLCIEDTYQTSGNDLVVGLNRRITNGSDTLAERLATITVPHVHVTLTGPQPGDLFICEIDPIKILVGQQLTLEVVTAYGGSGPVGSFKGFFCWDYAPETAANQSNVTVVTA
jgi:hypothetical protein